MSERNCTLFTHPYLFFVTNVGMQFNHELLTGCGATGERQADKNMLYVPATCLSGEQIEDERKCRFGGLLHGMPQLFFSYLCEHVVVKFGYSPS